MYEYFSSVSFFFHDFSFSSPLFSSLVSFSSFLFLFLLSSLSSYMTFFLFFFFSFLFLFLSFSLSFTAHTETTSTRQVTPPTKNGHAPRDPLNQKRAINLSILAMSHPNHTQMSSTRKMTQPRRVVTNTNHAHMRNPSGNVHPQHTNTKKNTTAQSTNKDITKATKT